MLSRLRKVLERFFHLAAYCCRQSTCTLGRRRSCSKPINLLRAGRSLPGSPAGWLAASRTAVEMDVIITACIRLLSSSTLGEGSNTLSRMAAGSAPGGAAHLPGEQVNQAAVRQCLPLRRASGLMLLADDGNAITSAQLLWGGDRGGIR